MKKKNILIVEDENLIALNLKNRLERKGYRVLLTATAAAAVELALDKHPDLILMDVVLKGEKSGIDAAGDIVGKLNVPIIFMTGNTHLLQDERLKRIPVYRIIEKPPVEKALLKAIEKLIAPVRYKKGK
jgi:CheY-like chemotaxis protein